MEKKQTFENKRKAAALGFQRFMLHVSNNHFDKIANDAILKHETEIAKLELAEKKNRSVDLDNYWDLHFRSEELKAIAEMKIVYAYKHFETSLKIMLSSMFENLDSSKLYRWETIIEILKLKKINIKTVDNYEQINEMREINNSIKHSIVLNNKFLPVEFKGNISPNYKDLLDFYSRIENSPEIFLMSLHERINDAIYKFDHNRLEIMVDEIEGTMDSDTALKFAKMIIEKY